ncbi:MULTISPECIES: hypothetical protein [Streptomyces]|uniref:hypothetical protein n=1 Tax=Streptomyces TaxID=1883 RepID=UPI001F0958FB|nr:MULTISPECIES: hypothetical protein [Streptomyces]MDX3069830.1 hypothetical protein [Streptomyces sp. ND04-05B]MDX3519437.1 hypothetical protein [Streptomyces scabiei]
MPIAAAHAFTPPASVLAHAYDGSNHDGRALPKALLDDVLGALWAAFASPGAPAAAHVSFGIAETGEGLAWNPDGPLLIGSDGYALPDAVDLSSTPIADALADLNDFRAPEFGDSLCFTLLPYDS